MRRDREPRRQRGRHVFHRMDGEIDAAVFQGLLELLGEEALAADLGERPVGHLIAGGADDDGLDRTFSGERGMRAAEAPAQLARLRQRELAAAGPDAQQGGCHASLIGVRGSERKGRGGQERGLAALPLRVAAATLIAMKVLGIETSCDETAAAVVSDEAPLIRSNVVFSQLAEHRPYGGIVPEIAARAHLDHLDPVIAQALAEAGIGFGDLDAVAATGGPGLIGGVIVGVMEAKAIALARGLPFVAVNHLEGHALTARLSDDIPFPFLLLLVSGGHCQLLAVEGVGRYRRLGTTLDDAAGEAFDKGAKLLGLGYPGGPAIERAAKDGDPARFAFPRPMKGLGCELSFSGLKTAVTTYVREHPGTSTPDVAASFQAAVVDVLVEKTLAAAVA